MNHELRFSICEAWFLYCERYHEGQYSKLYEKLCQVTRLYNPPRMGLKYKNMSYDAQQIHRKLVSEKRYQSKKRWKHENS